MLQIDKSDEIEQLRQMAVHLNADFIEGENSARLEFDNEHGKGSLSTYRIFPGLIAKTYDVVWAKEFKFSKLEKAPPPSYFIYCLEGHYYHQFADEAGAEKVAQMQNVVLARQLEYTHKVVMPPNVRLKINLLFLAPHKFDPIRIEKLRTIEASLDDLIKQWREEHGSKYFGEISFETAQYARTLIENDRHDTIGRLITEAAVLNTLASQLKSHEENDGKASPEHGLSKKELQKIVTLGDFINNNIEKKITIDDLSRHTGIYPKKLQAGCRFLFGESVAHLVQRLRMEKGRQLLQKSDLSVSEVCYKIGISSRSYFSKLYSETYGMTPSEFKRYLDSGDLVFELSYKSKAREELNDDDLKAIIESSIKNNKKKQITGALIYHSGVFFQIVEGLKKNILELYDTLLKDERHHDVTLIQKGVKTTRTFGEWSMGFLSDKKNSGISVDGKITYLEIESIIKDFEGKDVFSNLLWRRILNILKTQKAQ